jgi:hypothetical protein
VVTVVGVTMVATVIPSVIVESVVVEVPRRHVPLVVTVIRGDEETEDRHELSS